MSSGLPGIPISEIEVTNISKHGFWILIKDEELFLPFQDFPWFKAAAVSAILNVQVAGPDHLYWPDLDVDLTVESIRHPEQYPLMSKILPNKALKHTRILTAASEQSNTAGEKVFHGVKKA